MSHLGWWNVLKVWGGETVIEMDKYGCSRRFNEFISGGGGERGCKEDPLASYGPKMPSGDVAIVYLGFMELFCDH